MKFRLNAGMHQDKQGEPGEDGKATVRTFYHDKNNVIETDVDLVAKFGEKFTCLDEGGESNLSKQRKGEALAKDQKDLANSGPIKPVQTPEGMVGATDSAIVPNAGEHVPTQREELESRNKAKKPTEDGLDEMTVAELRTWAEESEIDLAGKTRKDEIIAAIRKA